MLEIDLHVHTLFSHCGLHTVLELIDQARLTGMKGLATTLEFIKYRKSFIAGA